MIYNVFGGTLSLTLSIMPVIFLQLYLKTTDSVSVEAEKVHGWCNAMWICELSVKVR